MVARDAAAEVGSPRSRKSPVPRLPKGCYKPSPVEQATATFQQLQKLMAAEWSNIRSMNLGKLSARSICGVCSVEAVAGAPAAVLREKQLVTEKSIASMLMTAQVKPQ